ncbi:DUF2397 domain-containing protein [Ktedonospora formicarum]|uniref:TIGR02677 family protein n=1 Tax=Ktedonospora formicarum TaxID=2778364 RepID=A0A8J3MVY7_9CHLR|nr:DUF2397 domain-containing protein [Ktedonospora formicarum]GHO49810.1 hypothetical protein KSX_79730 [Ktedonospora formicarum]
MNTSESLSITTTFSITDRLPIFSYLVSSNRIRWYRVIMRTFLQHHRELYSYQLTAHEVRDAVRVAFDPNYNLEQCQNDLLALKEWGNVTTIYDSSHASSIASFLSPALLYQATPEAIAIETFLDEQNHASAAQGSLRQGDLPRLWQALQTIDEGLQATALDASPTLGRELAEEWQRAFEVWNTMAREAAQYLANMINAAQQSYTDLEAFQQYKSAVVAYVHGFAQALTQYSRRIREQLAAWDTTDKQKHLISIIAQYLEPPTPTAENRRSPVELRQEAANQVEALVNWFAEGKNADSFRRNALAEVDKVVRRASTLAAATRPSANYATHLHTLARHLLTTRDGEEAQQLFSVAFANHAPIHLPESLVGTPGTTPDTWSVSPWQEAPEVTVHLKPVNRSNRGNLPLEDPIIDNRNIIRELVMQHETRLQAQREHIARLFASPSLDIGAMCSISTDDRAVLMEIIDACLGHPSCQYRALDGSTITLLNVDEQVYTLLEADDGLLFLPRYQLTRQVPASLRAQEEMPETQDNT